MEACGGAHFWGREIGKLGHEVRLIPPAYVKPFGKRQKNDAAGAEAICQAAVRPSMRFVLVKSTRLDQADFLTQFRSALMRVLASSMSFRISAVRATFGGFPALIMA